MRLEDIAQGNLNVNLAMVRSTPILVKQIQQILGRLRLYPEGRWIDGIYGSRTENALRSFTQIVGLPSWPQNPIDRTLAQRLLQTTPTEFALSLAKNRQQVWQDFQNLTVGYDAERLPILDAGWERSPLASQISTYPLRLKEKPDYQEVISLGATLALNNPTRRANLNPYPAIGRIPEIDSNGLNFLHSDITEACVAVGSFVEGEIRCRWLGRAALNNVECWSSTKFIPVLFVIAQSNSRMITLDIDNCLIRDVESSYHFHDFIRGIFTYDNQVASSNSLAGTMKRFATWGTMETWTRQMTGNNQLQFAGLYGEDPFMDSPQLVDRQTNRVILSAAPLQTRGSNTLSVYDLTRLITLLGWHYQIPSGARIPGAQWDSLESLARAMGQDTARYLDFAMDKLAATPIMGAPVVLSKMGFGRSAIRDRTELVYTALLRFVDRRSKPAKLRTIAMGLRAAKALGDENREAREVEARMAAEVTEILRRCLADELG